MQSDVLKEVIDDSVLLSQGYRFYEGYIFVAIREPANVFDAILIRNPSSAQNFMDAYPFSSHSLNGHINFINEHKIDKALIIADDISFISELNTASITSYLIPKSLNRFFILSLSRYQRC